MCFYCNFNICAGHVHSPGNGALAIVAQSSDCATRVLACGDRRKSEEASGHHKKRVENVSLLPEEKATVPLQGMLPSLLPVASFIGNEKKENCVGMESETSASQSKLEEEGRVFDVGKITGDENGERKADASLNLEQSAVAPLPKNSSENIV